MPFSQKSFLSLHFNFSKAQLIKYTTSKIKRNSYTVNPTYAAKGNFHHFTIYITCPSLKKYPQPFLNIFKSSTYEIYHLRNSKKNHIGLQPNPANRPKKSRKKIVRGFL